MENKAKMIFDSLVTLESKRHYDSINGRGSFERLYRSTHDESDEPSIENGVITRLQYDEMGDEERHRFFEKGGIVID